VGATRWLQVVLEAGLQTPRAEGAAEVQVERRIEPNSAEASDSQLGGRAKLE
jgi:hypothetical protein